MTIRPVILMSLMLVGQTALARADTPLPPDSGVRKATNLFLAPSAFEDKSKPATMDIEAGAIMSNFDALVTNATLIQDKISRFANSLPTNTDQQDLLETFLKDHIPIVLNQVATIVRQQDEIDFLFRRDNTLPRAPLNSAHVSLGVRADGPETGFTPSLLVSNLREDVDVAAQLIQIDHTRTGLNPPATLQGYGIGMRIGLGKATRRLVRTIDALSDKTEKCRMRRSPPEITDLIGKLDSAREALTKTIDALTQVQDLHLNDNRQTVAFLSTVKSQIDELKRQLTQVKVKVDPADLQAYSEAYTSLSTAYRFAFQVGYRNLTKLATITSGGVNFSKVTPFAKSSMYGGAIVVSGSIEEAWFQGLGIYSQQAAADIRPTMGIAFQDQVSSWSDVNNSASKVRRWHSKIGVEYRFHNRIDQGDDVSFYVKYRDYGPYLEYTALIGKAPDNSIYYGLTITLSTFH